MEGVHPRVKIHLRQILPLTQFYQIINVLVMNWRNHIVSDPQILRGKPCLKGTRIPAALVLGYLAMGKDTAAIIKEFPDLSTEDILACLDYARDLANFEAQAA